jgi:hypothetical protein
MLGKVCNKCKIDKPLSEYYLHKSKGREGKPLSKCILCVKEHDFLHKEEAQARSKKWQAENTERSLNKCRDWRAKNPEKNRKIARDWRERNPEKMLQYNLNRNKKKTNSIYAKNREKTDPIFKCKRAIRTVVGSAIRRMGYIKKSKTQQILGCSFEEFQLHFEKQFKPGMTWLNHGKDGWEIDHIIPVSSAKTEEEIIKLNHYTNLQPLWKKDNRLKGNRLILNVSQGL